MSKQEKYIALTPVGVADYPYLNKPDTKFKPEGEYKVSLKLDDDHESRKLFDLISAVASKALDQATAAAKKAGKRPPKEADLPIFETAEGYTLKAKMKASGVVKATGQPFAQAPRLFDANNKPWNKDVQITSGSKIRLCIEIVPYSSPDAGMRRDAAPERRADPGTRCRLRGRLPVRCRSSTAGLRRQPAGDLG